jgi:hypothetical protein
MKFLNFFLFLWAIFALLDPDPDPGSETLDSDKHYECGSSRIRARNNAHTKEADVDKDLGIVTFGRRKSYMKKRMKRKWGGGGGTWQCGEQ